MDINKLLAGIQCDCGRHHTCDIEYVYIESGAIKHLSEICAAYRHILLVGDENTFAAAGERVLSALAGKTVEQVVFDGKELLVPNEIAIQTVAERLDGVEILVGVGSGVIQDLCKYVSFFHKVPYVIVATAPSMDGYASNGAAMITDGMKVTYPAGLPKAILGDVDILKNAPMEMIKAGYGDVIGKFSALNDWKLSRLINGEYFCDYIYDLTYRQIQATLALADGILKREENSIRALMEALVVIGILMSFAGSSRPASGSEHHLSHFFEITGIVGGQAYFPHGIDVAYSTVLTAELRQKLLSFPFPEEIYRPTEAAHRERMQAVYGPVAEGCMALQSKIGSYKANRAAFYKAKEAEIKAILAEAPGAEETQKMLSIVGLDMGEFYTLYGKEKLLGAILYAKDLKDRYTVLWLYYDYFGAEEESFDRSQTKEE